MMMVYGWSVIQDACINHDQPTKQRGITQCKFAGEMSKLISHCELCITSLIVLMCHCSSAFKSPLQYTCDDPWNQAIFIWVESTFHINMAFYCCNDKSKSLWCQQCTCLLILVSQLLNDAPPYVWHLPLLKEIKDLFIDGEVCWKYLWWTTSPICVLPLLITANSHAHSEIGLTTAAVGVGDALWLGHTLWKF